MKVGLVCPYDWCAPGGVGAHVADLAVALGHLGHDVSVLTPAEDDTDLPPYVVSTGRPVSVSYNGSVARVALGPVSTRRVRRWLREGDFDVLHVHEPASPSLSALAVWAAQGPIVATWHSSMGRSRALQVAYWVAQMILEKVSGRIAVSEAARKTLVDHLGGDAVLIPNGVDCGRFATAEPLPGWPGAGPGLFFIGRIDEPRKGLPILLAAMPQILAAHPAARLLVAGPGDVDAVRAGLDPGLREHVVFLGRVSEEDKVRAFHSVDLYVAPHTGGESFGIVLAEAMASGTPVLASDLDPFRRVLDDGAAGALFRVGDSADLAQAAVALLHDGAERDRLAQAGLQYVQRFDWDQVAQAVVEVYESVTVAGEKVREDARGQVVGRLARGGWRAPR
ncbi:MAG TPA: glycosyltransferase family 4 protein [Candidatus Nanopelagicales bacterium]|nr:glycosyltransferase family 4 protein [Candidatus Nanopelagicales bacterium]